MSAQFSNRVALHLLRRWKPLLCTRCTRRSTRAQVVDVCKKKNNACEVASNRSERRKSQPIKNRHSINASCTVLVWTLFSGARMAIMDIIHANVDEFFFGYKKHNDQMIEVDHNSFSLCWCNLNTKGYLVYINIVAITHTSHATATAKLTYEPRTAMIVRRSHRQSWWPHYSWARQSQDAPWSDTLLHVQSESAKWPCRCCASCRNLQSLDERGGEYGIFFWFLEGTIVLDFSERYVVLFSSIAKSHLPRRAERWW